MTHPAPNPNYQAGIRLLAQLVLDILREQVVASASVSSSSIVAPETEFVRSINHERPA